MGVSIKNPEAERLIRELAELTGEGKTEAVTNAVRERIDRLRADETAAKRIKAMTEIANRMAPLMKDFDMDDFLYGENGLYDRDTGLPK